MTETPARAIAFCSLLLATGCGGGNAASELARPPEFDPKDQAKCGVTKSQARPLIVEWPSSDRAALEARVKQGIVPVRYVGCEMEVLTRCQAPGTYGYTGITRKSDRIVMRDADELYANIPVYAAKFEAKLQKAGALEVAMTIVGRLDATKPTVSAGELQGDCKDATHVISALTVGAFEFFAGAEAAVGGGMDVMGAGAGAKSSSQRETLNRDGDDKACEKATGEDKSAPFGCGALLRVEVVPLGQAKAEQPECGPGTAWDGKQCVAVAKAPPSAPTAPATASAPAKPTGSCEAGGALECTSRCDQGDAASCAAAGAMYKDGKGAPKDPARARPLLEKGCDGGQLAACAGAGEILYHVAPKDPAKALTLFQKACDGGEPVGCVDLGWASSGSWGPGAQKDLAASAAYFGKACNEKTSLGCYGLGTLYKSGQGVGVDPVRARSLFDQACRGGVAVACKEQPAAK